MTYSTVYVSASYNYCCQIDGGSYCNSFIDIIIVQVNYNLYIMQWLDVYQMSMEECHAKLEEELGEDDDKVYSTQVGL